MHLIETEMNPRAYKRMLDSIRSGELIIEESIKSAGQTCSQLTGEAESLEAAIRDISSDFPNDVFVTVHTRTVNLFPMTDSMICSSVECVLVTDDRNIPRGDSAVIEPWTTALQNLLEQYGFEDEKRNPKEEMLYRTADVMFDSLRVIADNTCLNAVFGYKNETPNISLYLSDPSNPNFWYVKMNRFTCEQSEPKLTDISKIMPRRNRPYLDKFRKVAEDDGSDVIIAANLSDILNVDVLRMGAVLELQNAYDCVPRDIPNRDGMRIRRKRMLINDWQMAFAKIEDGFVVDYHAPITKERKQPVLTLISN